MKRAHLLLASMLVTGTAVAAPIPALQDGRLLVDGKPYLILGGELGNSSASSRDYLRPFWSSFRAAHLNTVLAPVSWELIEPQEGRFDFASVDALIADARAADMRLVLLWFGSWKNSMSSYVPAWVKRDGRRFPRAQTADGRGQEILSAFAAANRDADARAFTALMAHLKAIDGERRTVLMVQIENEIGMLPEAREHGAAADAAFDAPVPQELMARLTSRRATLVPELRTLWEENGARGAGTWREVFGSGLAGEEVFTAWHYARFADAVTRAGKAAYALPMYLNVALNRPGRKPGDYPSGGPLPHLIDVWQAGAPSIDMLSPDIYFPNFGEIIARYDRPDNTLFVPEANNVERSQAPAEAFLAIGGHKAIGYSPFSVESLKQPGESRLAQGYRVLAQLAPQILDAQRDRRIVGLKAPVAFNGTMATDAQTVTLGGYRFRVEFVEPFKAVDTQDVSAHGGLILQVGPDEFYVAGSGITVYAEPIGPGLRTAGIESAWEGEIAGGAWKPGRLLNGDQTHQGRRIMLPGETFSIQRVRYYRYD